MNSSSSSPDLEPPNAESPADFGGFYRHMLGPLRDYLAKVLGDRAEAQDVAQNAFVRIQPVMSEGRAREPRLLLFATARRLALNEIRRRAHRHVDPLDAAQVDAVLSAEPSVESIVSARQELAKFEEILLRLPPGCRQVFLLRKVENLSHADIAERLGISVKTIENHMTRAYRLLREAYHETETPLPSP